MYSVAHPSSHCNSRLVLQHTSRPAANFTAACQLQTARKPASHQLVHATQDRPDLPVQVQLGDGPLKQAPARPQSAVPHPGNPKGSGYNTGAGIRAAPSPDMWWNEGVTLDLLQPCLQLVRQGEVTQALDLLQQLTIQHGPPDRDAGDTMLLVRPPAQSFAALQRDSPPVNAIAAPAGAGRVASALACLQILPTHKGHHYYQLIKHYCSKRNGSALGQLQLVLAQDTRWQTYQQIPLAPWFCLIRSYGILDWPDLAAAAFDDMWRLAVWQPSDVKTANALLNALHADAHKTYERFKMLMAAGLQADRVTFNTLLKACMRGNLPDKALHTFRQMQQLKVPADEHTYTTLIKTLSYAGRVDDALMVQQAMAKAEFVPTDTVWGSLMVACGKAGQLESALRLWQGFKEARGGLHNVQNPEPCVALLIACGQTYQLQPALAILSEMKQAGVPVDVSTYNCVMAACRVPPTRVVPAENLNTAFELYTEMQGTGLEADCVTYATLMDVCAEARQGQRAVTLMQELQGKGAKLNTVVYTAFIKACGASPGPGLVDAAHAAFMKMIWGPRRIKPNHVTFVTMVRVLREGARPHDALDVYLGMRRAGFPGVNTEFQELVKACAEAALETNDSKLKTKVGEFLLQFSDHLSHSKRLGQAETVDLHTLSVKEARAAVLCVLCNIQERFKHGEGVPSELAIIVGRGQHPQQGGPKLKDTVQQLLQQQLHMDLDQVNKGQSSVPLGAPANAGAPPGAVPSKRAKPVSKSVTRTDDRSNSSSISVSKKPNRSFDEVTSSSDDPQEMTAQLADALRGNQAWQSRQGKVRTAPPATGQKPKSSQKKPSKQNHKTASIGNEGRVVVSQDTLLRWLESKAL